MSSSSPTPSSKPISVTRAVATGFVLAGAALTAGGIFCFPLYAPALVEHLSLTQPQLSTIALVGLAAQYPLAAAIGSLLDTYGTWTTAALAAGLFTTGFGAFAHQIGQTTYVPSESPNHPFRVLVFCYLLCGVGTAASLFTVMFSASQTFPGHTGISIGASTAFFGLSPLFLSVVASNFFSSSDGELDVTHFVTVLSIVAGIAHVIAAVFLRLFPPKASIAPQPDDEIDAPVPVLHAPHSPVSPTERTPLIPPSKVDEPVIQEQSVWELLKDVDFWLLIGILLLLLGSCEMVLSNIGTMILGVPETRGDISSGVSLPKAGGAAQVRLLSLSNTLARLLIGPLSDYLAPAPLAHPTGELYFPRKRYFSRLAFLSGSCLIMVFAYLWMAAGVQSQRDIYLVSIATGAAYGSAFTVSPSIVASLWMGPSAGRNFGIITYAPFVGTPIFSYLYAFIAASYQSDDGSVCTGTKCWKLTFWITTATSIAAFFLTLILLRRRRDRV